MTKKELVQHIKQTGKFVRTYDDYTSYFIFVFPISIGFIGFSMIYNYFKFHSEITLLLVAILFISMAFLFGFHINRRLKENITFESISTTNHDIDTIAEKLKKNFKGIEIKVNHNLGVIEAYTKMTGFSWGEKLTLIIDKNSILINSKPSGTRQPITILKDRKNIKKLKQIL